MIVGIELRAVDEHDDIAVHGIDWRLHNVYVGPADVELLGYQHRQRRMHFLSHFDARDRNGDAIVGADLEPGIERDLTHGGG